MTSVRYFKINILNKINAQTRQKQTCRYRERGLVVTIRGRAVGGGEMVKGSTAPGQTETRLLEVRMPCFVQKQTFNTAQETYNVINQ